MLLPVGWAPGPDPVSTRRAELLVQMREACLPTHCRDGRRAGAGPNQAEAWGKASSCPGAGGLGCCRSPTRLPHKAGEAQRCPGAHSVCVPECGLTPEALRSEEAERPALGAACRFTQQGVSLG